MKRLFGPWQGTSPTPRESHQTPQCCPLPSRTHLHLTLGKEERAGTGADKGHTSVLNEMLFDTWCSYSFFLVFLGGGGGGFVLVIPMPALEVENELKAGTT